METPAPRQSREAFKAEIANYLANHCRTETDRHFCLKCGSEIKAITCTVSVHDTELGRCTPLGTVESIDIPFCPNCEPRPTRLTACIHV